VTDDNFGWPDRPDGRPWAYDRNGDPMSLLEYGLAWGFGNAVDKTVVGDVEISTVWLGIDHGMWGDGPPIIFETMVFGGEHDRWCQRYATAEQAQAGHDEAVRMVRGEVEAPR
jgi:hypothetical protein